MLEFGDKDRLNRKGTSSLNIGCSLARETMGIALWGGLCSVVFECFVYSYSLVVQDLSILEKVVYEMRVLEAC